MHKIAKNWPPPSPSCPKNVRIGSIPIVRSDTPKISKNPKFFAPKSADVRIWRRPPPSLSAKCPHWTNPSPLPKRHRFRFRYSFICQGTLTSRQLSDLYGLRVKLYLIWYDIWTFPMGISNGRESRIFNLMIKIRLKFLAIAYHFFLRSRARKELEKVPGASRHLAWIIFLANLRIQFNTFTASMAER